MARTYSEAKCIFPPVGKALEKQKNTIKDKGRKQINAITNQNRIATLTNKDDRKDNYEKIFENLVKKI